MLDGDVSGRTFDFLTSNYGGLLPSGVVPLTVSKSVGDACQPLSSHAFSNSAVLVTRGNCPFDVKVLNVQNAGGSVVVIEDPLDRPLQRIGGSHPLDGQAGIPTVAVTYDCSEYIRHSTIMNKNVSIIIRGDLDVNAK